MKIKYVYVKEFIVSCKSSDHPVANAWRVLTCSDAFCAYMLPQQYNLYALGREHAQNTPFQRDLLANSYNKRA